MSNFDSVEKALREIFGVVRKDEPLSRYTTLGVGGTARFLVTARTIAQLEKGVTTSNQSGIPFRVLGCGSNVIVSDSGYPGLIILNRTNTWQVVEENRPSEPLSPESYPVEHSDENEPPVIVRVDSGVRLSSLMKTLFREGITGLQWFAGIPGTIGGAIYMNMHGGNYFLGDLVARALLVSGAELKDVDQSYFNFGYDWSVLHETKEIVLQADLKLRRGDVGRARQLAREWARRKALQPQKSAGCIFQNLTKEDQIRLNLPTGSVGYLIEHVLKLKGLRCGDAIISPRHAGFIENLGQARAADVMALIDSIREQARVQLGLELKTEVEFIGTF